MGPRLRKSALVIQLKSMLKEIRPLIFRATDARSAPTVSSVSIP